MMQSRKESGAANKRKTGGFQHHQNATGGPGFKQHHQSSPKPTPFNTKLDPPFGQYWSKEKVQRGLKNGTLFQGNLVISYNNFDVAFINNPSGGPQFMIEGMMMRNRALSDDLVVVTVVEEAGTNLATSMAGAQSLPSDLDSSMSSPQHPSPDPPSTPHAPALTTPHAPPSATPLYSTTHSLATDTPLSSDTAVPVVGQELKASPEGSSLDSFGQGLKASLEESSADKQAPSSLRQSLVDVLYSRSGREVETVQGAATSKQRRAKVVYISEKVHNRACVGTIRAYDKAMGLALLSPRDRRVPRVFIPLKDLPKDFLSNFKENSSTMFVCHIKDWPAEQRFPNGRLVKSIGEAGTIEAETDAILLEYEIYQKEFPTEVEDCLPKDLPWTIPAEEVEKRRDFRGECIFTIDPETARDLDDALHVKKLSQDVYEVGVHIADVGYFVKPGTALDDVASRRATSTYLVHKVIPMLPRLLCENLCSLNPNEDKLSFSVVWQLSSKGELISQWIGQSIMRSCSKLSYGDAQNMIDGVWSAEMLPPITGGFPVTQVVESVLALNNIANVLRKQRRSKGTLRLDQPKLHYFLNESTGMPFGCEVYPIRPSNRLIEEFMLMANMSVARCISDAFPMGAMLRRHPPPKDGVLQDLADRCAKVGLKLDITSASTIQDSLDQCKGLKGHSELTEFEKMVYVVMCVKAMELAIYFSAGLQSRVDPHHYALNVPLYTHFTSPIRRYADIVVHRQLAQALKEGADFSMTPEEVEEQATQCNKKKKAAKIVGDSSLELFFALLLKETGPQTHEAVVMSIKNKTFEVLLKEIGLVRTVFCDKLDLVKYELVSGEAGAPELKLTWAQSATKNTPAEQTIRIFSEIEVTISASSKNILQNEVVIKPQPKV